MARTAKRPAERKLLFFNMVSLDGCFASVDGGLDWHVTDKEFNAFAAEQIAAARVLVFGRVTYELMAGYWPTPAAIKGDPLVAGYMNDSPKVVFSRTLKKADWAHTRLVKTEAVTEMKALKKQAGPDMIIFGSAQLSAAFTAHRLIDEYRVMVNPVMLGRGRPLFPAQKGQRSLRLTGTRLFSSGNVLLTYQPR